MPEWMQTEGKLHSVSRRSSSVARATFTVTIDTPADYGFASADDAFNALQNNGATLAQVRQLAAITELHRDQRLSIRELTFPWQRRY